MAFPEKEVLDRFRGCLIGLAIGDALGMPVEGLSRGAIQKRFGRVRDFLPSDIRGLKAGQWTDDTKMALCHADSLIERGKVDPEDISRRFVAWLDSGDLRGIGATTREALLRLKSGVNWRESGKRGKWAAGNGAAMRIAPVGLFHAFDTENLLESCRLGCIMTHNNEDALAGAAAVALSVAKAAVSDFDPKNIFTQVSDSIGEGAVSQNISLAAALLESDEPVSSALAKLGTSGYVAETVASAIYLAASFPDNFEDAVVEAVIAGGDADTTAAVTGAICGAVVGHSRIPERWSKNVEEKDEILARSGKLFEMALGRKRR